MIVQAMIIFYGLRQSGVSMTTTFAGILVTTLNTGAYMAETVRGGIGSIDLGQREGAWAMGMSPMKTMLYIVLPQAFRNIIPEMANTFLNNHWSVTEDFHIYSKDDFQKPHQKLLENIIALADFCIIYKSDNIA